MKDTANQRIAPGVRIVMLPSETAAEGSPVNLDGRVIAFSFEDTERKRDKCSLQLDNYDFSLFERGELMGGAVLEVSWGYPGNMSPPRRMVVKKIKGLQSLTLEGHAMSVLMNQKTKTRVFVNVSAQSVVSDIAMEYGYSGQFLHLQNTGLHHESFHQVGETDAQFLRRLAAEYGYEFWIDQTGLHWHEREQGSPPTHVFTYHSDPGRGDILSLSIESDLMRRVGKVTVKGRDPREKTTIESSATNATVERSTLGDVVEVVDPDTGQTALERRNATEVVRPTAASAPATAQAEAQARFRRAERSTLKLSMQVVGDPSLAAKAVVELKCNSSYISGKYYVEEAKHAITGSGYICDLKLTRDSPGRTRKNKPTDQQPQGGEKNSNKPLEKMKLRQVEVVDSETGNTHLEFRSP